MLFLLSPAKSLYYDTPLAADIPATQPVFEGAKGPAAELIGLLQQAGLSRIAFVTEAKVGAPEKGVGP